MTYASDLSQCQLVILCGGLGTRLKPLTDDQPKSLIEIEGKPFIQHQIELVRSHGIARLILCVSHLGEKIESFCADGSRFGVSISYSREPAPLGTAGALKLAEPLLDEQFFIMYGDAYLPIDYARLWERLARSPRKAVMAVFKNQNRWGMSNVVLDPPLVAHFEPSPPPLPLGVPPATTPHGVLEYIDYGVSALRKEIIRSLPAAYAGSMNDVFASLAAAGQLDGFEVLHPFFEIGSHAGLEHFQAYLRALSRTGAGAHSDA